MSKLYQMEGGVKDISPIGKTFTFGELYPVLRCSMIQVIHLKRDQIMLVDEEAKFDAKQQYNRMATVIAKVSKAIFPDDFICGNAVVCSAKLLK